MAHVSKKDRRIESKKRKAAAFLKLVEEYKNEPPEKESYSVPVKKSKSETPGNPGVLVPPVGCSDDQAVAEAEDERKRIRKILEKRRKEAMARPKLFLCLEELRGDDGLPPLFILDIQHLILFALEGNVTSFKPRWCKLFRWAKVASVVVVVLDGVGEADFQKYRKCFSHTEALFDMSVSMVSPSQYGRTVDQDLFRVPSSVSQLKKAEVPRKLVCDLAALSDPQYRQSLSQRSIQNADLASGDAFPRTHLLLSTHQMSKDNYPLPILEKSEEYKDFVFTCEKYSDVTNESPMFCIDCEMCITGHAEGKKSELTWIAIVNEDLEVIYETLVKPYTTIVNYLTRFSGVTKEMLKTTSTRLEEVQRHLQSILPPDAILCGQSLNADLTALKMFHPYVIDTSVIYCLSGYSKVKPSLRKLSSFFLGKLIQDEKSGHNPAEDAISTMELVKLKLKKDITFGDVRFGGVIYPQLVKGQNADAVNTGQQQNTSLPPTEPNQSDSTNQDEAKDSSETDDDSSQSDASKHNTAGNSNQTDGDSGHSKSLNRTETENPKSDRTTSGCDSVTKSSSDIHSKLSSNDSSMPSNDTKHATDCCDVNSNSLSLKKVQEQIDRRKHFFQAQGYNVEISFFERLKTQGKTATLIDSSEVLDRYRSKQDESVEMTDSPSDKATKSSAKMAVVNKDFVWAQLHNYQKLLQGEEDCTDERKKRCLQKMDKRLSWILSPAHQGSLCVVILTGRTDDNTANNAMSFVRIKV